MPMGFRSSTAIQFERPVVHTNAYKYSFFPHNFFNCNAVPLGVQSCTFLYSLEHGQLCSNYANAEPRSS